MLDEINGLPGHVLLVHAVVVLIPLTCLLLVLAAASTRLRERIGIALPLLAAGCLVLVPLTVSAGEDLRRRIGGGGELVADHAALGEDLLPYAIGLLLLSLVVHALRFAPADRSERDPVATRRPVRTAGAVTVTLPVRIALTVVCVALSVATVVQVVRIGDSGSKAVWDGVGESS